MALDYIGEAGQIKRKAYQRRLPENPSLDYYYIIRDTGNAESILIEYGFISNTSDLEKINSYKYQFDINNKIINGITKYLKNDIN